jgi:hypothetical protein
MTQLVQFEGTTDAFPDDFTQADISAALDQVQPRSAQRTINVHTPDRSNFSFPEGTPEDKIVSTLRAHFGTEAKTKIALGERSAAGRVARSLYRSPAQNAAEAQFAEQMGRYGALASRAVSNSGASAQ